MFLSYIARRPGTYDCDTVVNVYDSSTGSYVTPGGARWSSTPGGLVVIGAPSMCMATISGVQRLVVCRAYGGYPASVQILSLDGSLTDINAYYIGLATTYYPQAGYSPVSSKIYLTGQNYARRAAYDGASNSPSANLGAIFRAPYSFPVVPFGGKMIAVCNTSYAMGVSSYLATMDL